MVCKQMGLNTRKLIFRDFWTTGTDQPANPHSLISAFVVHLLESIISKLATGKTFTILDSLCSWGDWFESHFVGPNDWNE